MTTIYQEASEEDNLRGLDGRHMLAFNATKFHNLKDLWLATYVECCARLTGRGGGGWGRWGRWGREG